MREVGVTELHHDGTVIKLGAKPVTEKTVMQRAFAHAHAIPVEASQTPLPPVTGKML